MAIRYTKRNKRTSVGDHIPRVLLATVSGTILIALITMAIGLYNLTPSLASEPDPITPTGPPPRSVTAQPGSDGTWVVGEDLRPGTYWTVVPTERCMWATLKGFSLAMEDIINLGEATKGQRLTLRLDAKIRGLESHGCGTWTRK